MIRRVVQYSAVFLVFHFPVQGLLAADSTSAVLTDVSAGDTVSIQQEGAGNPTGDTVVPEEPVSSDDTVRRITETVTAGEATGTSLPAAARVTDSTGTGEVQSLDRMVVSATRTRRRISETPASVSVISRQEIERSPAKDINDLIANKTGVQVRRFVGMGEGVPSDIIMRGIPGALAAARTLILVDGIPTNASGTPFMILNEIPVEIIDNIEIVRGPYSSLYGANAFGGVINVLTKKGDGRPGIGGTFETSYPFSVANSWSDDHPVREAAKLGARQALWNGDLMSGGGGAKWNYLVNGGYRTIGNYMLTDSALVKKTDTSYHIPARNYDYTDLRLFGKFGYRPNERLSIDLHTRYFKSNLGFGYTRYSPDTTDIDIRGEKLIIGPQVGFRVNDNVDLKAVGYIRRVTGFYANEMNRMPVSWLSEANDWQIDLQGIVRPHRSHVVTAGTEFLSNGIRFGDLVNQLNDSIVEKGVTERITNAGAYIQDEWAIGSRFRAVPGIRIDYHTLFGYAVSPKLGISATVSDAVHLRASLGRAFRAPNHTELFMPPLPLKGTITVKSNPDLKPEYIWAADGGIDLLPFTGLKLQCGVFYNYMQDLISQGVDLGATRAYVTHENISSAWSTGVELEAEWRVMRGITLQGSYVFQQSRNESASENAALFKSKLGALAGVTETDIKLDYIPTNKGSIGISMSRSIGPVVLTLSLDELLVGKRTYLNFNDISTTTGGMVMYLNGSIRVNPPLAKLPMYARTDILLRGDFGNHFYAVVALQNCFDARYEESFGTYAPGRLATLKGGFSF